MVDDNSSRRWHGPAAILSGAAPSALTHLQMRPCRSVRHVRPFLHTHSARAPHCNCWASGAIPLPSIHPDWRPLPPGGLCPCCSSAGNNNPLLSWLIPTHASEPCTMSPPPPGSLPDILPTQLLCYLGPCPYILSHSLVQLVDDLSSPQHYRYEQHLQELKYVEDVLCQQTTLTEALPRRFH